MSLRQAEIPASDPISSKTATYSEPVLTTASQAPLSTPIIRPDGTLDFADGPYNSSIPAHTQQHWWMLDYWDTTSGGSVATSMSGEFVAQADTFSGLQNGWDGLNSWFDAILYLPLNVAYGPSSSNCVWFQFDVQFAKTGCKLALPVRSIVGDMGHSWSRNR